MLQINQMQRRNREMKWVFILTLKVRTVILTEILGQITFSYVHNEIDFDL